MVEDRVEQAVLSPFDCDDPMFSERAGKYVQHFLELRFEQSTLGAAKERSPARAFNRANNDDDIEPQNLQSDRGASGSRG